MTAPPATYDVRPVWNVAVAYGMDCAILLAFFQPLEYPEFLLSLYGVIVGMMAALLIGRWSTEFRSTGLSGFAAIALVVAFGIFLAFNAWSLPFAAPIGFLIALSWLPLYWYVGTFPYRLAPVSVQRRLLWPIWLAIVWTFALAAVSFSEWSQNLAFDRTDWYWVAFAASVLLSIWSWAKLNRAATEFFFEVPLTLCYKVYRGGPGLHRVPQIGPVLVIANHACWFDPLFVSKVLPRPATPMMTAKFFSVWFIKPLLKYIFKVIVVPESPMRREAPELKLAIAALDRGECVMLFPEGYLRRKEEVPLRRFGQGVWQILKERPDTPVVACWVEGGWGAWCSYFNGPPTKNKRMDFRRRMVVGLSEPETVPAEILADQMRTRIHLMNRVAAVRPSLGLPALPIVELPTKDDESEK